MPPTCVASQENGALWSERWCVTPGTWRGAPGSRSASPSSWRELETTLEAALADADAGKAIQTVDLRPV